MSHEAQVIDGPTLSLEVTTYFDRLVMAMKFKAAGRCTQCGAQFEVESRAPCRMAATMAEKWRRHNCFTTKPRGC